MKHKEKDFESDIEQYFITEGGYEKGTMETYDKKRAIDMTTLTRFVSTSQPKVWNKYQKVYGDKAADQLYKMFESDVSDFGLLHVLRNGIKDQGMAVKFCYFEPASKMNTELVEKYNANILTCTRQFAYSAKNNNTVDIVLLLNGIPVVAIELKDQITGQNIDNAKHQFMFDRDPKELIFHWNTRVLTYFAVDLDQVAMTTQLRGEDTFFLPFNQGSNGAGNVGDGGNPQNPDGYTTAYLWERVLKRDMLLAILQRYISVQEDEKISLVNGKKNKKVSKRLIFPRYHQLDVVEKLVDDTRSTSEGKNYLIQHSAGSGKSNSIAWLTYRLSSLHNDDDEEVFQTVFVVTDRRILNRQLQNTILGFDHKIGQIVTITDKDNSQKLKDAINDKKRIIITTLHRFPLIYKQLDEHAGKNFAIIVDEAHSSQSGKSAEKLKAALADTDEALREMAELEGKTEDEMRDEMDQLTETLLTQGQHKNLYFYAFTATPKPKTLQTFGTKMKDGKYSAFHHYSMRQAIDEGFIHDVLKFYTTFATCYEIGKTINKNPEYEEPPAERAIKAFHDNHQRVLEDKIKVIVETFRQITLTKMEGKAKAMLVSPSRAHAVRYLQLMRAYCNKMKYDDVHPLVAFSGSVRIGDTEYTEPQLNSTKDYNISEGALPLYFGSDMYNMLIVAEKYQTGFDEPRLHTMFVDKHLRGVKAVQTLSRLNRTCSGKIDTYVLDFANTAEEIAESFRPFYEDTLLKEGVDINTVYKYKNLMDKYYLWSEEDEKALYEIYSKENQSSTDLGKLAGTLKNAVNAYNELEDEKKFKVRYLIKNFNRFYAYMAQVARTFDKDLYRTYIFTEYLYKLLPKNPHTPVDLDGKLALLHNKLEETFSGAIVLKKGGNVLKPEKGGEGKKPEEKRDLLDNIIEKINMIYAGDFTGADRVMLNMILDQVQKEGDKLRSQTAIADQNMFVNNIFPKVFDRIAQKCYTENTDSFQKLFQNAQFYKNIMTEMAKVVYWNYKE